MKTFSLRNMNPKKRVAVAFDSGLNGASQRGAKKLKKMAVSATTKAASIPVEGLSLVAKQLKAAVSVPRAKRLHKPSGQEIPVVVDVEEENDDVIDESSTNEIPRQASDLETMMLTCASNFRQQEEDEDSTSTEELFAMASRALDKHFRCSFNESMLVRCQSQTGESSHLDSILFCTVYLIQDLFESAKNLLLEATEKEEMGILRSILIVAQQSLEQFIEPHVFFHLASTELDTATTPSDAAKVISLIDCYFGMIDEADGVLQKSQAWEKHLEDLVEIYLERGVHVPMKENLRSYLKLSLDDDDVFETRDGTLRTGNCSDIFFSFMYNIQLETAEKHLPSRFMGDVVAACNEELRYSLGESFMRVGTHWKEMSVELLCSIVTEASSICDACEDRNSAYLVEESHVEAGEDLCREATELALFVAKQLCERIMLDLSVPEPILTTVGDGALWDKTLAVQRTNATLGDYFEDLKGWIPRYFFSKVLQTCFDLSLERYVEAFFCNSLAGKLGDTDLAAWALRRDYSEFVGFWNDEIPANYPGVLSGFYSQKVINQRLHLLMSFSLILTPFLQPEDILKEMETVLAELGSNGAAAILHLIGLKKRCSKAEALQWHEMLTKIEVKEKVPHCYTYRLPDLRNSRYLKNVTPRKECVRRLINRGRGNVAVVDINSTSILVQNHNLQKMKRHIEVVRSYLQSTKEQK